MVDEEKTVDELELETLEVETLLVETEVEAEVEPVVKLSTKAKYYQKLFRGGK